MTRGHGATLLSAPVGITLFRRPEYTERVLSALEQCYGVDDRTIYLSIDWDENYSREIQQVTALAREFTGRHERAVYITTHTPHGIDVHKEWLIREMLGDGHDRFIFLEDDILLAKDALHYFDWALERFRDDPTVVDVCGYRKTAELNPAEIDQCYGSTVFCPWGWAMWGDRWSQYWGDGTPYRRDLAEWFGPQQSANGKFDYWWFRLCERQTLKTIFPSVARTHNFGKENGEHTDPTVFDHMDYNAIGAWQIDDLPDRTEWRLEAPVRPAVGRNGDRASKTFLGFHIPPDGYGYATSCIAREMKKVAPAVSIADMCATPGKHGSVGTRRWRVPGTVVAMCTPDWLPYIEADDVILFTMFESTRLPVGWTTLINERTSEILVPCKWNDQVFRENGVAVPIHVAKLGIDPADYFPLKREHAGKPYTFLWSGTPDRRKGWDVVYRAFWNAFGDDERVRLVLHFRSLPQALHTGVQGNANVEVSAGTLTLRAQRALLQKADCYVFPSRGEGWGSPPREAAATGLPVIATRWGGLAEEIDDWAIPLDVCGMSKSDFGWDAQPDYGEWAEPDIEQLTQLMRWCFEEQDKANAIGTRAARWLARNASWKRTAERVLAVVG